MHRLSSCFSAKRKPEVAEELLGIETTKIYSYKELRQATEDFSPTNKIGEGGFGSVYRGILKDRTLAAIKVLAAESRQGVKEFMTEITIIANIKHDNLVTLYGCCVEGNHRILVYGYLENNSLSQTLLDGNCNIEFSWDTRRRICMDVAKGLAFLHEGVRPHVIHRDIKASNILLDDKLVAKISDFGLAKLFPAHMTHISTRVAGTAGYLAPEYAIRGQLTSKADIYSFGVLILEIVSGRCNTNRYLPPLERYLLENAWNLHENGKLGLLIDKSMEEDFDVINEACNYLKIGLLCTQDMPRLRPTMSTVVKMLTGEIDVEGMKISRPGLLTEFMGFGVYDKGPMMSNNNENDSLGTISSSTKLEDSTNFTSAEITSSFTSMTFTSIYDRTV